MLKEFIDRILDIDRTPNYYSFNEKETLEKGNSVFCDTKLHEIVTHRHRPDALKFNTLSGIIDFLNLNKDNLPRENLYAHVKDYRTVELIGVLDDRKTREVYATSEYDSELFGFKFNRFYDTERFIIELHSSFADKGHRNQIIKMVSSLSASGITKTDDDGVSQKVTVSKGVHLKAEHKVQNPIILAPFLSFPEIDTPEGKFVFRVRQTEDEEEPTECTLFEAGGGALRYDTIIAIAKYLKEKLPKEVGVIA